MKLRCIGLPVPSGNWDECETCAAQPGSPRLCDECLKKRSLCHNLQDHLQKQQDLFLKHGGPPVEHRIAVKAFIVASNHSQVLFIKRRPNDPHKPGVWDLPGGRLLPGEHPYVGLAREVEEETNLVVVPPTIFPLDVHHFTRDDGQLITMLILYCRTNWDHRQIKLSEEHTEHQWVSVDVQQPRWEDTPVGTPIEPWPLTYWKPTLDHYNLIRKNLLLTTLR